MKEFISTEKKNFSFGDCSNCEAKCCNGKYGTVFSQIILEEFEKVYKNFPILFIFGDLNFIKPVILLTNGNSFCPYLENFKCSIYKQRPTVCQTYPLSPNIDNKIYIDNLCPEINKGDTKIIYDSKIYTDFDNKIFYDYQSKYIQTHFEFEKFKKSDFKKLITINKTSFYIFGGKSDSKFIKLHKDSLDNLSNFLI